MSYLSDFKLAEGEFVALESNHAEIFQLEKDLNQLCDSGIAIERFGSNPTAIALLQTTGLLSGTALQSVGLESFMFDGPNGPETGMAMETLGEKIKEKAAQWSAKILSVAKEGGQKVISILTPLWEKIKSVLSKLGEKSWDTAKSASHAVAAHPFKTILAVAGAIAAVAAILAYCGSFLPGANAGWSTLGAFDKKVSEMISKIHWPFGKVSTGAADAWRKHSVDVVFAAKAENIPIDKLGWTQSAAKTLYTHLDQAFSAVTKGVSAVGASAMKVVTSVGGGVAKAAIGAIKKVPDFVLKHTGSPEAAHAAKFATGGIIFGTTISIIYGLWRLVKKIVLGGFKVIFESIRKLLHV